MEGGGGWRGANSNSFIPKVDIWAVHFLLRSGAHGSLELMRTDRRFDVVDVQGVSKIFEDAAGLSTNVMHATDGVTLGTSGGLSTK